MLNKWLAIRPVNDKIEVQFSFSFTHKMIEKLLFIQFLNNDTESLQLVLTAYHLSINSSQNIVLS